MLHNNHNLNVTVWKISKSYFYITFYYKIIEFTNKNIIKRIINSNKNYNFIINALCLVLMLQLLIVHTYNNSSVY